MATAGPTTERLLERAGSVARRLLDHPLPWLAPTLLVLAVFQLYPMVEAVLMSFTNESLVRTESEFVGLAQYARLATDPQFREMLQVTGIYAFSSVVLHVLFGLMLALAIDYGVRRGLRGHLTTRVSVLLAWIVPGIIIGLVWKVMLVRSEERRVGKECRL